MVRICSIIVHHQGSGPLEARLEGVLQSEDVEVDVVVASSLGEEDLLEETTRDARIDLVAIDESVGLAEANNIAVRRSIELGLQPDFFFFLSNGATVESSSLATLAATANENPECGIVGPRMMIKASRGRLSRRVRNVSPTAEVWDEAIEQPVGSHDPQKSPATVLAVAGEALLIRATVFEMVGGWEQLYAHFYEDIDLCLKTRARGWEVLVEPAAVAWLAISPVPSHDAELGRQLRERNRLLLMLIHWPAPLLRQVCTRVCGGELRRMGQQIKRGNFRDAATRARSWGGVGKRIFAALRLRKQQGAKSRWTELLREPGSVRPDTPPRLDPGEKRNRFESPRSSLAKILVCGMCPLPFENTLQNYGPGIRTWQFAWSLAQAGHEVILIAMETPGIYGGGEMVAKEEYEGVAVHRLSGQEFMEPKFIRHLLARHDADAVVGATIYGSFALAQSEPDVPFWADQFGHVMAEAQAKAALERANWPLAHWWKMVEPVMRRADRVSTVSQRQRYAAIGELGALGRLTHETCGYDFTAVIPCALIPNAGVPSRRVIRGIRVSQEDFIVLWSGGYNVWSDVETLFESLELAMREDDRVHFVSTGGEIKGHDSATYARFRELIESSNLADRFHLEGWVRSSLVPSYVAEADLGILTEQPIYEGLLGSKNRIIQWMGEGLPVAYNRVGDLGDYLFEKNAGLIFEPGDSAALAQHILWAASHPQELSAMGRFARSLAQSELSFATSTRDLLQWAKRPEYAPDAAFRTSIRQPLDHGEVGGGNSG